MIGLRNISASQPIPALRKSLSTLGLVLCVALSNNAHAWGDGGHMIVASIAYTRLSPTAKQQVDQLLGVSIEPAETTAKTSDFVQASHWADDVRPLYGFDWSAPLHFIDQPFSADKTALPTDLPPTDNVVGALTKYVAVLNSDTSSNTDKAQGLRFVIHFVGDIHQPLHCATRVSAKHLEGDRGGNLFMIGYRDSENHHERVNLHSFWDQGGESFPKMNGHSPPSAQEITVAAKSIADEVANSDRLPGGAVDDYAGWASESEQIATSFVYRGLAENEDVSDYYKSQATKIARQRVGWAGYRLAALLNSIWPEK